MVSLAKLPRIRQGIGKKYKNIGLENISVELEDICYSYPYQPFIVNEFNQLKQN
jgi:hypothetical protein